jgi:hypothetical protein
MVSEKPYLLAGKQTAPKPKEPTAQELAWARAEEALASLALAAVGRKHKKWASRESYRDSDSDLDSNPFRRPASKAIRVVVKGRGAVDPASGLERRAHVLERSGVAYSATLNKTDVAQDANSFYVLQVIEDDAGGGCQCHLWRR